jgi:hypothetical protein
LLTRSDNCNDHGKDPGRYQVRSTLTRDVKNIAANALTEDRKERAKHAFAKLPQIRAQEQQPTLDTHESKNDG